VWKPEGKRPLGTPRRRWEDNIKKGLREVGCGRLTESSVDGRIILRWVFRKWDVGELTEWSVDGRIILRWVFRKWDVGELTESSWLRIGTGGRSRVKNNNEFSGSIKMRGISRQNENPLASQE
jgi:hypothetical protein